MKGETMPSKNKTSEYYETSGIMARIRELQADELSQEEISDTLTAEGFVSSRGGRIDQSIVSRVLRRAGVQVVHSPA